MIEGGGSDNFSKIKAMALNDAPALHRLLDIVTDAVIAYLSAQRVAGAQALQIFDTWGGMLSGNGRTYMLQGPWLALAPGICLTLVVYAINVFGDALRDMLDPRMRGSR